MPHHQLYRWFTAQCHAYFNGELWGRWSQWLIVPEIATDAEGKPPGLKPSTGSYPTTFIRFVTDGDVGIIDLTQRPRFNQLVNPLYTRVGIMPSSTAIRTYVTPVTLRALKGALASETPRNRESGVQTPHRTCYSVVALFTLMLSCVRIDTSRCAADSYSKKPYQVPKKGLFFSWFGLISMLHDHTQTCHTPVGLLWASDQPDAETSTWQNTTLTTDKHLCP